MWNTTITQERRLEAFHQYCLRRVLKVRFFHRVKNEEILDRASVSLLLDIIRNKRLRWFGHVSRMPEERLPRYLLDWVPKHGGRTRGRPRNRLNQTYMRDAEGRLDLQNLTVDHMKNMAAFRDDWRRMTQKKLMNVDAVET